MFSAILATLLSRRHLLIYLAFYFLSSMAIAELTSHPSTTNSELRVLVKGLASDKGRVRFRLFHTEDTYLRQEDAFREEFIETTAQTSAWVVKNIPVQEYAVVIYHDENNNEEFDRSFLGIPQETYGFSNNVRPRLAQPAYADVKFSLDPPVTSIEIEAQ